MKKAKLMLSMIAVITVVGGALAFKANSKFSQNYCLGVAAPDGICSTFAGAKKQSQNTNNALSYYTLTSTSSCATDQLCNGEESIRFEGD
jgi:hypothetical protein